MSGRVELWDAINAAVVASGGMRYLSALRRVARQKAVVRVESAVDALVDAARDTAHAAGYAEGVAAERAAIVEWIRRFPRLGYDDILPPIASRIEDGAHVGAAKKGGG